jgi:hypothetical protein
VILSRKKSTTLNSWRVVIALWSCWWENRHYELKVRPIDDCKVIFFLDRIAVALPQWENGLTSYSFFLSCLLLRFLITLKNMLLGISTYQHCRHLLHQSEPNGRLIKLSINISTRLIRLAFINRSVGITRTELCTCAPFGVRRYELVHWILPF